MGAELEDDPLLGPAAFVFQTRLGAKKTRIRSSRGGTRLSGAQIGRIARRRPEVMVKVTGSARGLRGLKEHLAYITRNGKLAGERENGERIEGAGEVRALAEEWWADGADRRKNTRDTINLILSMPPGTDQDAVADAAR
ncbi:MAG TPA: hypothetical protein VGN24_08325, partial [Rhodanobacter sp.]|nr:hypothetical protein [Rhodanobacter sp.]